MLEEKTLTMATPRAHILTPDELEGLMEKAIRRSRDDLKILINEVLDERQELVGHPNTTADERAENKADAVFLRSWRLRTDKLANRIGNGVLTALAAGALYVVGLGGRKLGWWP